MKRACILAALLSNPYALPALEAPQQQEVEDKLAALLRQTTSTYASHPAVGERIALVERLAVAEPPAEPTDAAPAWSLLPPAQQLQTEMTAVVQKNVRQNQSQQFA
jgi:hypothetical protein